MKFLDIGEVVRQSGVPASTLRYYEERGLIAAIGRHGLRRQYEPAVILQLALIGMGKAAGFSLEEIGGMFGADGGPDLPRAELHRRAEMLERQMRRIGTLAAALRHVADCPAPSHLECPGFQRLLRLSARRTVRDMKKGGGRPAPA